MNKIKRMLVFLIISTGCLFSQSERNDTIKEDSIMILNSAVVTEVDTVVIEESVSEPEEKIDFIQYDFYNGYLSSLPTINSTDDTNNDTLPLELHRSSLMLGFGHTFPSFLEKPIPNTKTISFWARIYKHLCFIPKISWGEYKTKRDYGLLAFSLGGKKYMVSDDYVFSSSIGIAAILTGGPNGANGHPDFSLLPQVDLYIGRKLYKRKVYENFYKNVYICLGAHLIYPSVFVCINL